MTAHTPSIGYFLPCALLFFLADGHPNPESAQPYSRWRELYKSINKYSKDIVAEEESLNPLAVLKTAIQLHQRQPSATYTTGTYSTVPPLKQPEVGEKQTSDEDICDFEVKLARLKYVLSFVSEVKLASLLTREKGNMNAAVQRILDDASCSSSKEEKVAESGMDGASLTLIHLKDASNADKKYSG